MSSQKIQTQNQPQPLQLYECEVCGLKVNSPNGQPVRHTCKGKPSLTQRAANYGKAVATWDGKVRTQSEVERILAICTACHLYRDGICTHRKCGCRVNRSRVAVLNKIKMATQHCPIKKW